MNHLTAARNALKMLPAVAAVMVFGFMAPAHSAEAASITQETATAPLQAIGDYDDKYTTVCITVRGVRVCFPVLK